jgi:hypothetical protein
MRTNLFFLALAIGLSGCNLYVLPNSECLRPEVSLSNPSGDVTMVSEGSRDASMPNWWKSDISLITEGHLLQRSAKEILFEKTGNFWILLGAGEYQIVRINSNGNIEKYDARNEDGDPYIVEDIYLATDNSLWLSVIDAYKERWAFSYLARLEKVDEEYIIKIIIDNEGLLKKPYTPRIAGYLSRSQVIAERNNGNILYISDGRLIEYNKDTNIAYEVDLPITEKDSVRTIMIDDQDVVWYLLSLVPDLNIRSMNITTGNYKEYAVRMENLKINQGSKPETFSWELKTDYKGRIWLSNIGWLQLVSRQEGYIWNTIYPRSEFVSIIYYGMEWDIPIPTYQYAEKVNILNNGDIWFESGNGIVSLNKEHTEWCWRAPLAGGIAEDNDGNIYTLVDGILYKYSGGNNQ